MEKRFSAHGGLTLVPMPGFEDLAHELKPLIEKMSTHNAQGWQLDTPVDIAVPEFGYHKSGEAYVKLGKQHVGGHDCVVLTSGPGTDQMRTQAQDLLLYMAGRKVNRCALVAGYLPLGRSDKDEGTDILALAPQFPYMACAAARGKLDRIISADLHCPQLVMAGAPGLITEIKLFRRLLYRIVTDARQELDHALSRLCVIFPDDGAVERCESAIDRAGRELEIELPVIFGQKRRKSSESCDLLKLNGETEALAGSLAVIFDDEAATCKTTTDAAKEVIAGYHAAKCWAAVTHGVLCGQAPEILGGANCFFDYLYITDTIPPYRRAEIKPFLDGRLRVVSWTKDLANIIYHNHWDENIREDR